MNTNTTNNDPQELSEAELEQISGSVKGLAGDEIGQPRSKKPTIKGMESIEDDEFMKRMESIEDDE